MESIPDAADKANSSPRTLWEFLDKWLHKLARGGERIGPIVKVALIAAACGYLALVGLRIWLISQALTTFGVDIAGVLPVDPATAELIHKGMSVLLLFSPDAIIAYVLLNRRVQFWRAWTAAALVLAVGASWWATHEPGLGTHCYVVTPDLGLIESYADKNGRCGVDRTTGLQMSPVTKDILLCIRALKRGIKPKRLAISDVNGAAMFDAGDGHSLYWFHRDSASDLNFYDGPGFDQASLTPLEPVTRLNADFVGRYIKQRQEAERTAREEAAAKREAARLASTSPSGSGRGVEAPAPPSPYLELSAISGGANWTAVAGSGDTSALQVIVPALAQPVSLALFKPAFYTEGLFTQALMGDVGVLKRMHLPNSVARVVLIQADQPETTKHNDMEGLVQANQTVRLAVIEPHSGRVLARKELLVQGAGFAKAKALERLREDLGKKAREGLALN